MKLTVHLAPHQLLMLPADAVTRILEDSGPSPEFLAQCQAWEICDRKRKPVLQHLRKQLDELTATA